MSLCDILSGSRNSAVFVQTNTEQGNKLIKNLLAIADSRVKSDKVSVAKSIVQQLMQPQPYHLKDTTWFNYIEFLSPYEFIATHTYTNMDRELKNGIVFVRPFGFYSKFEVLLDFDNNDVYEAVAKAKELVPTVDFREIAEKDKSVYPQHLDIFSIDELVLPFDFKRRVESISEDVRISTFFECVKKVDRGEHYKMHQKAIELCKELKRPNLANHPTPYLIDLTTPVFVSDLYVEAYYLDCFNVEKHFRVPLQDDTKEAELSAVKRVFEKVKEDKNLSERYKEALPAICQWWADKVFGSYFPQSDISGLTDILLKLNQDTKNRQNAVRANEFKKDLSRIVIEHIDRLKLECADKSFYTINHYVSSSLQLATDYSAIREPLQEMEKLGYSLPAKCYTGFNYDKGIFEGKAGYGGKIEEIKF